MTTAEDQGLFAGIADYFAGRTAEEAGAAVADYLARRKAEEAEVAARLAPAAAVPADPTVRDGLARMLRPRRRTQTLRSWFSHRDVPSWQSVCSETVEVLTTTNSPN